MQNFVMDLLNLMVAPTFIQRTLTGITAWLNLTPKSILRFKSQALADKLIV